MTCTFSPAEVLALAGQKHPAAIGGDDLVAAGARMSTSDLMAPERVHECCRILDCKPIAQVVYNVDDAVSVAGIASVIAAEIGIPLIGKGGVR